MVSITIAAGLFAMIAFTDAASQFPEGFKEYDCMLDRDCPLNNLTTSKVEASIASLKECKKRCDADDVRETCKSFVWNEDDKMCYLKNTVCTTENSTALPTISTVYCAAKQPIPSVSIKQNKCMINRDCTRAKNLNALNQSSVGSFAVCKKRCDDLPTTCKSFIWNETDKTCWLKDAVCKMEETNLRTDISFVYCY